MSVLLMEKTGVPEVNHRHAASSSFDTTAPAALLIFLLRHRRPPPPSIHVYTFFFRIQKNYPEIVFFARDYASRDQIYHFIYLTLKNIIHGVLHNLYI